MLTYDEKNGLVHLRGSYDYLQKRGLSFADAPDELLRLLLKESGGSNAEGRDTKLFEKQCEARLWGADPNATENFNPLSLFRNFRFPKAPSEKPGELPEELEDLSLDHRLVLLRFLLEFLEEREAWEEKEKQRRKQDQARRNSQSRGRD